MAIHRTQPQRRSGRKLWIIPVLLILLVAWLAWSQKNTLMNKLGLQHITDTDTQSFSVGEEVTLSGALSSSNNLRHYTMMLTTADDGILGVKSNVLDLSSYRGKDVIVRGTISTIVNNVPVINAVSLVSNDDNVLDDDDSLTNVQYLSDAGIILDPDALEGYTVTTPTNDEIIFSHENGSVITLSYFRCTDDDSSATGCAYILDQLADAPSRFTGTDGDEWVQLSETNAWFGSNDNRIGYRISDADKATVTSLMEGVTFINDRYVTKTLLPAAKDTCQTVDHTLSYVSESSFEYHGDIVQVILEGSDTEGLAVTCEVAVDPRTTKATLTSIDGEGEPEEADETDETDTNQEDTTNDDTDNSTTQDDDDNEESDVNTDAAPALGTELPFTSSKGYTIVFPSSNVAFQGVNNTESLGIEGVSGCWSQMNVVAFSSAAHVVDNPAIIMYDCRDVDETLGSLNGYIRKDGTESDKTFFIKVVNPERDTFANAITIK